MEENFVEVLTAAALELVAFARTKENRTNLQMFGIHSVHASFGEKKQNMSKRSSPAGLLHWDPSLVSSNG